MRLRLGLCLALALALALAMLGCAGIRLNTEPAVLGYPVVDRLSEDTVRIRWPAETAGPVTVYAGPTPETIDHEKPLARTTGTAVDLHADAAHPGIRADQRLYYELVPATGTAMVAAERRLPLQGPDNFRDLGGYPTRDGRTVRWGQLFRANDLAGLTGDDLRYLKAMHVRLVCDFRSEQERSARPDREVGPGSVERLDLAVAQEGADPSTIRNRIRTGGIAALELEGLMLRAYRSFVTDYSPVWRSMFERIANPAFRPTVVHCTAGKDRTGFASALVLLALGVPEEIVFEDYLLTNHYQEDFRRMVLRWVPLYSLFRTEPEDLLPLLEARSEYLQASLDTIDAEYGSVDVYLEQALGLGPEQRESLRAALLR